MPDPVIPPPVEYCPACDRKFPLDPPGVDPEETLAWHVVNQHPYYQNDDPEND